jgi:predicted Zn-dependent protease with MMP-like domain
MTNEGESAMRFQQRLQSIWQSLNRGRRPRPRKTSRRPVVELLESRTLLTTNLYLDFGEGFRANPLQTTVQQQRDTIDNGGIQGPEFDTGFVDFRPTQALTFTSMADYMQQNSISLEGDGVFHERDVTNLELSVLSLVRRYYAPFDVNVTAAAATGFDDIRSKLRGTNDTYVLVVAMTPPAYSPGAGGDLGVSPRTDLNLGQNTRADSAFVFFDSIYDALQKNPAYLGTAVALNAAHEAAHTFGLRHTNDSPEFPDSSLLTQSDIIAQFSTATLLQNVDFFTRFPLQRGSDDPTGVENPYEVLKANLGLRPNSPAHVTGTGANNIITIKGMPGNQAQVSVEAFRNGDFTGPIDVPGQPAGTTTYGYTIDTSRGIVVDGGFGNDRIILDGVPDSIVQDGVPVTNVTVDGGAGTNELHVIDQSNANADYEFTDFGDRSFISRTSDPAAEVVYSSFQTVEFDAGSGNDIFDVEGTALVKKMIVNTGGGNDHVNVGTLFDLSGLRGDLIVNGQGGQDALDLEDGFNIEDQEHFAGRPRRYTLDRGAAGTNSGVIKATNPSDTTHSNDFAITYSGFANLRILSSVSTNTFIILATVPGTATEIRTSDHFKEIPSTNTFYVGGVDNEVGGVVSGTVKNVVSALTIHAAGGPDELYLRDASSPTPDTVTVTPGQVGAAAGDSLFGSGGSLTYDGISKLTLTAAEHADTINVTPSEQTEFAITVRADADPQHNTLVLHLAGAEGKVRTPDPPSSSGTYTFSNRKPISFMGIETEEETP